MKISSCPYSKVTLHWVSCRTITETLSLTQVVALSHTWHEPHCWRGGPAEHHFMCHPVEQMAPSLVELPSYDPGFTGLENLISSWGKTCLDVCLSSGNYLLRNLRERMLVIFCLLASSLCRTWPSWGQGWWSTPEERVSGDICPGLCALLCGAHLFSFMIVESEVKHSIKMQPFSKLNAAAVVVLENLFSLT